MIGLSTACYAWVGVSGRHAAERGFTGVFDVGLISLCCAYRLASVCHRSLPIVRGDARQAPALPDLRTRSSSTAFSTRRSGVRTPASATSCRWNHARASRRSEATRVWVAYTKDALYIAVRCDDRQPDRIVATEMLRDGFLMSDDNIEIVLDTFHDRRNAYYFATNPAGVLVDGRVTENRFPNREWDGIWNVRTSIDEQGWTAEFEIPFKSLGFNGGKRQLGLQHLAATWAGSREFSRWASPSLDVRLSQMARAGAITGLEGLSQGVGLDIKPYAIGGYTRDIEAATANRDRPGRRRRHLLPHHVQPGLQHDLQHRFRRDRGRRPPGQPDAFLPVLPGAADLLPRRCRGSSISPAGPVVAAGRRRGGADAAAQRRPPAVLLPAHRTWSKTRTGTRSKSRSASARSSPARWDGSTLGLMDVQTGETDDTRRARTSRSAA